MISLLLLLFLPPIYAHGGGGMNMGTGSGTGSGMIAFLHFTPLGDTLWFQNWTPTSPGAIVGSCIGLFLLAIFERWIAAGRAIAEKSWDRTAQLAMLEKLNRSKDIRHHEDSPLQTNSTLKSSLLLRHPYIPPFIPSHDIARGILHLVQTVLKYLFMLAAMTFQLGFIISISLGAGVGEMMFGRYISAAGH